MRARIRSRLAKLPLRSPAAVIATWFGAGLLPVVPGTWGSLAALPFAWVIVTWAGPWALAAAAAGVFAIGCWAAGAYERMSGTHDPGPVVVDEVAAQWLTLLVVPADLLWYLVGFLIFRVTDIVKPWPARTIDRRVTGGIGVMLDDIVAGLYAAAALFILHRGLT